MEDIQPAATLVLDPEDAEARTVDRPELAVHLAPTRADTPPAPAMQAGPTRGANLSLHPTREPAPCTASILEAILFAADTPMSATRLAELAGGCGPATVRECIERLNEKYGSCGLSFRIEAIAGGYQMMTLPAFRPWILRLNRQRSETRLSDAALETLAIIAYRQPVIRADIEAIRGVACGEVIGRLREMGLVRIAGRAEIVGRPILYSTTRKFLDVFGLADLDDLPPMEALKLRPAREQPLTDRQRSRPRGADELPEPEQRAGSDGPTLPTLVRAVAGV